MKTRISGPARSGPSQFVWWLGTIKPSRRRAFLMEIQKQRRKLRRVWRLRLFRQTSRSRPNSIAVIHGSCWRSPHYFFFPDFVYCKSNIRPLFHQRPGGVGWSRAYGPCTSSDGSLSPSLRPSSALIFICDGRRSRKQAPRCSDTSWLKLRLARASAQPNRCANARHYIVCDFVGSFRAAHEDIVDV